ncbi:hypothetical protein V1478_011052 [Vespula squamosa]|uniref:Uncharacterized protein n=1 Tax=Vespula squamosa TaxID=30214 RepID=A0ABD2AIE2_VESSQ
MFGRENFMKITQVENYKSKLVMDRVAEMEILRQQRNWIPRRCKMDEFYDPFTRTQQLGVKTVCLHETALMSIYTSNEANFAALWLITARTCSLQISMQTSFEAAAAAAGAAGAGRKERK